MTDRWQEAAERLAAEELLTCAEAAFFVPAVRGERCRPWSVTQWITRGKGGVFLDGVRATGRGWHTSRPALVRFWAALSRREVQAGEKGRSAKPVAGEDAAAQVDAVRRMLAKAGRKRKP